MTDPPFPRPLAAFRGPVSCQRNARALTLSGLGGDSHEERLMLTFFGSGLPDVPESLAVAEVLALEAQRYRIAQPARSWEFEAASVHVHRDVGKAFYRAIPPRAVPLTKRLFWRAVLALAGSRAGKRLLASLRAR